MDLDVITAELGQLITQMQHQPEDRHELYQQLVDKLNEMRAVGLPLPDDLVELEQALAKEFAGEMTGESDGADTIS